MSADTRRCARCNSEVVWVGIEENKQYVARGG